MSGHCRSCGQFTRADAQPMRFVNLLGDPVESGPFCTDCEHSYRDLAARNVYRKPCAPHLIGCRDDKGWDGHKQPTPEFRERYGTWDAWAAGRDLFAASLEAS